MGSLDHGDGACLSAMYDEMERRLPDLVDSEPDPFQPAGLRWHHDMRWEIETLVVHGVIRRRKDLGRGRYALQ